MAPETFHHTEIEEKSSTTALNGELAHQMGKSEQRKDPFWQRVGVAALTFLGIDAAGRGLVASQTSVSGGPGYFSFTNNGGVLDGIGTALWDIGGVGLLATAGAAIYGLFRNRRQKNEGKATSTH